MTPAPAHRLSKSRVTYGLQCHKQLWWRVYERDSPELRPDARLQALFDQGIRVGQVARSHVPGGVLIDAPHFATAQRVAQTEAALAGGAAVVYEATFVADGVYVAVDILERTRKGFTLVEVKSSTHAKDHYVADAAIQTHVARRAGIPVTRVEIMHLNRACTYPDLSNLFTRADVTDRADEMMAHLPGVLAGQLVMLDGLLPDIPAGPHCTEPYDCPFLLRCNAPVAPPPRTGPPTVAPGLVDALAPFVSALASLDFETVAPAIPVWNGCRPFEQVPAQFSCHLETAGGLEHRAWLAEGPADPRPAIARAVVDACRGARAVVAYYASFERGCLRHLAAAVPALAAELDGIAARLVDPHPLVKRHVAHPGFGGSFGIKAVLPVLVPGMGYDDLAIAEGESASNALSQLMFESDGLALPAREALRTALLAYCERDTIAMVRLLERLRALAGGA